MIHFFKLQYLYQIGLLKEKELYYFKYYMDLVFKDEDYGLWDYIDKYQLRLQHDFVDKVTNLTGYIFDNKDSSFLNWRTHVKKIFGLRN